MEMPNCTWPEQDGEDGIEENTHLLWLWRLAENFRHGRDMSFGQRKYLQESLDRAIAGDSDPFRLKRPKGRQPRPRLHLMLAETVGRLYWDEGHTLDEAEELAGPLVAESLKQWSIQIGRSRPFVIERLSRN
jgi:hypothetical protein